MTIDSLLDFIVRHTLSALMLGAISVLGILLIYGLFFLIRQVYRYLNKLFK